MFLQFYTLEMKPLFYTCLHHLYKYTKCTFCFKKIHLAKFFFFLRKCRGPYHKITKAYLSFLYHTGINFSSTIGHGRCRPGRLYLCKMLLLLFYMHTLLRKVKLPQDYTHHYDYCSLPSKNSLYMLLSANTILHTSSVFKFSL